MQSTLRIAVLILPPIQLLDLSPVDLFHMLSKQYLRECNLPGPFVALGIDDVRISYVAESGPSKTSTTTATTNQTTNSERDAETKADVVLAETTASLAIRITHGLEHPDIQPGMIDILLIPGPDPSNTPSSAAKTFIRSHANSGMTTVMSVCTGIIPLAQAGVLDGRVCTGPRALLGMFLRKDFPQAKWVEKRWVVDPASSSAIGSSVEGDEGGEGGRDPKAAAVQRGELWTAGGITNGQDMVAAYIRAKFDGKLSDLVCAMAEVGDRGQEYETGAAVEGMWWGRLLLRSWIAGLFGWRKK